MLTAEQNRILQGGKLVRTGMRLLLLSFLIAAGCKPSSTSAPSGAAATSNPSEKMAGVPEGTELPFDYLKVRRQFLRADFFKPREGSADDGTHKMAPLIVREADTSDGAWRLGVPLATASETEPTTSQPASERIVYYFYDQVVLGRWIHKRITYLWVLRHAETGEEAWCGVRQIRGIDGRTIVSEVIGRNRTLRECYVAQSIEDKAWIQFGKPLKDRLYAIEAAYDAYPRTYVARVISDGPEPMGPFVYLEPDGRTVTTLLCRCMTSQYEAVRENAYYDLRPLLTVDLSDLPSALRGIPAVITDESEFPPLGEALRMPELKEE